VLAALLERLNFRKNRALLLAQSSLSEHQFAAFRKLFLDEFGQSGLERDMAQVLAERKHGNERNGQE